MSAERGHVFWNGTFSDPEKRQLVADQLPLALDDVLAEPARTAWTQRQRPECLPVVRPEVLPARMIFWLSRIASAWPTRSEVRPPFLDHRIVEFANRLPASFKVSGSRQKIVLQQLMSNKLPQSVLHRPKVGFDIPAHDWLRGPLRNLLVETLRAGATGLSGALSSCGPRRPSAGSLGKASQYWLSPMGIDDSVVVDEKVERSGRPSPPRQRAVRLPAVGAYT